MAPFRCTTILLLCPKTGRLLAPSHPLTAPLTPVASCMIRKLYLLVAGECKPDNPDAPSMHETLLPGHLLSMFVKEKLNDWTLGVKLAIEQTMRRGGEYNFTDRMLSLSMPGTPCCATPSAGGQRMHLY